MFDTDATIITAYMDGPDKDYHTWGVKAGIVALFASLIRDGHRIALIGNHGAAAFGYINQGDIIQKYCEIIEATCLPADTPCYYDASHERGAGRQHRDTTRRLPEPTMLLEAMTHYFGNDDKFFWDYTDCFWVTDYDPHIIAGADAGVETMSTERLMITIPELAATF